MIILFLLFLAIFLAGWYHTTICFLLIIAILEIIASFCIGYKDSLKEEDNDGKKRV